MTKQDFKDVVSVSAIFSFIFMIVLFVFIYLFCSHTSKAEAHETGKPHVHIAIVDLHPVKIAGTLGMGSNKEVLPGKTFHLIKPFEYSDTHKKWMLSLNIGLNAVLKSQKEKCSNVYCWDNVDTEGSEGMRITENPFFKTVGYKQVKK